jgi:hypothetical protein
MMLAKSLPLPEGINPIFHFEKSETPFNTSLKVPSPPITIKSPLSFSVVICLASSTG